MNTFEVQVTKTSREAVRISEVEARKVAVQYLKTLFNLPLNSLIFTENGSIMQEYEVSAGSHSYYTTDEVRPMTGLDQSVMDVLNAIDQINAEKVRQLQAKENKNAS